MINSTSKILRMLLPLWLAMTSLQTLAKTPTGDIIRVGFFESVGMFEGAADDKAKSGYCYDYMMQIASYTGWKYEFCYGSFAELYEKLKNGEIDILPYTNYNTQRGKEVLFSDSPLAIEEYYLAVKRDSKMSGGVPSLNGAVISTMTNADYNSLLFDFIKANDLDVTVNYYQYVDEIWEALRQGEADATIYTSNSYSHDGWECVCSFGDKPTYICVAKGRRDLLDKLNDADDLITKENPALKENLYAKYFSDNPVRKTLTEEEQVWLDAHPVIHVGGLINDAPDIFSYDETTHSATGLTVDIIHGIIERLDLNVTADFRCYDTIQEMEAALDTGEIDVLFPFYPNHYLAQGHNLFISNTVRVSNMSLVFKKGTSFADAISKVATPATRLGVYYVQSNYPESEIVPAVSVQDAVDRLLRGESSGAVAQNFVLENIRENYDNLNSIILAEGCGTCFATRPTNYPLLRILNRGLIYFTNAEVSAIAAQYALAPNMSIKRFLAAHNEVVVMLILVLLLLLGLAVALLQVSRLRTKADVANKAKTAFLNNMSHDIRTPLNAITGFNNMALMELGKDDDKVRNYLGKIDSSSSALLTIINDILEISRIEAGKITLADDKGNVMYSFVDIESMMQEVARKAGIDLQFSIGQVDDKFVICDFAHCGRIFTNLISNAIKYTKEGGYVKVHCEQTGRRDDGYGLYTYTVEDNGIGMSESFQKELFEPFARERTSTVSKIQGTGLGLALTKDLISLMDGTISCESRQGEGTTFTVTLPLKIQEGEEYAIPKKAVINIGNSLEGKHILLVEDNELNREIACTLLNEMGATITEAEDGVEAVGIMKEAKPGDFDFILMDVQMPIMDGYEATRTIRAMGTDISGIPIIAMTANAYDEDRRLALEAGMNDHIAKPIDIDKLKATLANYI